MWLHWDLSPSICSRGGLPVLATGPSQTTAVVSFITKTNPLNAGSQLHQQPAKGKRESAPCVRFAGDRHCIYGAKSNNEAPL